jgi:hypothetical protein
MSTRETKSAGRLATTDRVCLLLSFQRLNN